MGDPNLDGNLDLVIPGMGSSNAHIMLGKGDGTFTILVTARLQPALRSATASPSATTTRMAKPDVAMSSFTAGNVLIFRNTGTLNFATSLASGSSDRPATPRSGHHQYTIRRAARVCTLPAYLTDKFNRHQRMVY